MLEQVANENIMRMLKRGFTLAETLLTLLIIGIISSIVIPEIIADTQQAELKIAWKKAYGIANQTWRLVLSENPNTFTGTGGWGGSFCGSPHDGRWDAFKAKFNKIKECNNSVGCWASNAENAVGYPGAYLESTSKYGFVSNDGMYWKAAFYNIDNAHVAVDVNGERGPNKWGIDMYEMLLQPTKVVVALGDDPCARSKEPFSINGRSVYFTKPLYE
jgi:prepilin-type N-terminal cleavage/methylation domain-containing protein